jgi:uncharacterized protein with PIN domain
MYQAKFYFHGSLNDFFIPGQGITSYSTNFKGRQSVKHLFEALGVPHTEVGAILVAGQPVDFSYIVQDGDQVDVYPCASPDGILPPRFVLDNHLGKLAAYLRMVGFDTLYRNDYHDEELAQTSSQEERILLTRDIRLLMRRVIVYGYWIREKEPGQQLVELLQRYGLFGGIIPFKRCLHCNGLLQPVDKENIIHRLEPLTKIYYDEFRICPDCDQIYWKGSHYERMIVFIEQILRNHSGK